MSDPAVLRRIQALLDKAASTSFPAEAEALFSKAQELMTRHAIDEAALARRGRAREDVTAREHVVDGPYAAGKAALLGAVLRSNSCRLVLHGGGRGARHCTIVGHPSDVEQALGLYHGLMLHGVREMLSAPVPEWEGVRAFRHAFLLAFAARIRQRLADAARAAANEPPTGGTSASGAIVLADRTARVDHELQRLFPHLGSVRRNISSGIGYASGRAAADRAGLGGPAIRSAAAITS